VEWVVVYLTSRRGHWRLRTAGQPVSTALLVAAVLGMAIAIGLWWLDFDVVSLAAKRRLHEVRGPAQSRMASALLGGTAVYVAGNLGFSNRVHGQLSVVRLVAVGLLLACVPAAALLPPLAGLARARASSCSLRSSPSRPSGTPRPDAVSAKAEARRPGQPTASRKPCRHDG
jgi:hypothetical protein